MLGRLACHHGMRRGPTDVQPAIAHADALQLGNPGQADQNRRRRKPLLHRRHQRLTARQGLRPILAQKFRRLGNRGGFHEVKVVHLLSLPVSR
jgi:hypothetical protein